MAIKAKNKSKTRSLFRDRLDYKGYAYSAGTTLNLYPQNVHDLWHKEYMFYGKVSMDGFVEPMEPYPPYLKGLATEKSSVHVLNFVADAFNNFKQEYLLSIQSGRLDPNDPMLSNINPVKAYISVDQAYDKFRRGFHRSFMKYLKRIRKTKSINTMDDFLAEMFSFFSSAPDIPFTKSAFVMSRYCDPLVSGLSIDLMDLSYSDDEVKKRFIDSPNFEGYVKTAANHGFLVDKNIPWRLVAYLRSGIMVEYAKKYRPEVQIPEDVARLFYVRSSVNELEAFKMYAIRSYNRFVKKNPVNITFKHSRGRTKKTRYARAPVTKKELLDKYPDSYWLDHFIRIRNKETTIGYSEPALKEIVKVSRDIEKTLDMASAMMYIKRKFSGVEFYDGSLEHTIEKSNQSTYGTGEETVKEAINRRARSARKKFF